ncbi:MAG: prolipoprotein diacylglyceryl transferase [Bacilli bacterium]|nr:prolipoprotein diacylglyceryl transferase [Bacilli bacterium]
MNPVLFTLFGIEIRWYSVLLLTGMIIAMFMFIKEGKRFNIPKDFTFNLAFWVIIIGIISARLYYCVFNFSLYKDNLLDIFKIWEGGLAIHGGLIGGFITLFIYTKKYSVNTYKITDMAVVPLLLAQSIGRWGNFFNSEAHGVATTYYHLKELHIPEKIIEGMKIGNVYYHPTFFYESLYCLVGFIILLFIRRYRYLKRGQLTCIYLMYYSVGRFFIESLRTDSLMFGGFRVAQIISVVLFVIGLIAFMILGRKGRFEDLYNEEQSGPIRF